MANETNKLLLATQQEKPNHYTYLKEFRVEQCQSFLQHKCNQHRPFICFNWHFQNQRRRRPIRKRDGTFNYSADNYCTKYDETTGICPDGDDCPFLHRTAGDTERRYHLRYYKTCMCVHDTDSRGYCVKNGHHCAFAHGIQDQRPPVYDIKELETLQNAEIALDGTNAQNALDKERNLMNEDPKWQDTNYVLANYKTEPCKRPPRLCRQGYACPQYHNSKDKRRSPRKFKYRSTPCPNVKHGEEWGEPGNCEAGDNCQYCHTRTEQQFHPEIYKSTKCNDVQQAGYCPRSVFCAFAHVEPFIITEEKQREIDGITTSIALSDLISSALPDIKSKDNNLKSGIMSIGDNSYSLKLPQQQQEQQPSKLLHGNLCKYPMPNIALRSRAIKPHVSRAIRFPRKATRSRSYNRTGSKVHPYANRNGNNKRNPRNVTFNARKQYQNETPQTHPNSVVGAITEITIKKLAAPSKAPGAHLPAIRLNSRARPHSNSYQRRPDQQNYCRHQYQHQLHELQQKLEHQQLQQQQQLRQLQQQQQLLQLQQHDRQHKVMMSFGTGGREYGSNVDGSITYDDTRPSSNCDVSNSLFSTNPLHFNQKHAISNIQMNYSNSQSYTQELINLLGIDGNDTNNILVNALENSANQSKFINFSLPLDSLSACSIDDPRENSLSASLANSSLLTRSSAPINIPNSTLNNSINDFNSSGFAVNIPGSSLNYSPTNHSNLFNVSDAFSYGGTNSNKLSNSLSATQNDSNNLFFPSRIISPGFADGLSISPSVRISELNTIRDDINSSSVGNSLFDNSLNSNKNAFSLQSLQNQQNNSDVSRLNSEIMAKNTQIMKLSSRIDDTARKLNMAEIQREKAKQEALEWKDRYDMAQTQLNLSAELRNLSIQKLKQLQSKLRTDLEEVEKVLYLENAKKCMKCEENNRTVTLEPCNHFILCDTCACSVTECPYCQIPVVTTHT